jgi:hypothetical protein
MFSVEKWLFSVTLRQGARSQALQLRLKNWFKKYCSCASEGVPHLEAREGVGEDTEKSYSAKSVWNIAERLEKKQPFVFVIFEHTWIWKRKRQFVI